LTSAQLEEEDGVERQPAADLSPATNDDDDDDEMRKHEDEGDARRKRIRAIGGVDVRCERAAAGGSVSGARR